ncbi:MAG: hypothetical protein V7K21_19265 [Nostoc sp.]|uniref:hypothetical protein n=1 Tax=Nostoc sp. TaxID=1180 RepID=UPI002FFCA18D
MIIPFSNQEISEEIAIYLWESSEKFPVEFELACSWLGYSTKANAKRKLVKYFRKDLDYKVFIILDENSKGGRPEENIWLTVNCLKEMGMMAGTEIGWQVRQYFLQCEEKAKESAKTIGQLQCQIQQLQENFDRLSYQVQKILPPTSDFMPSGWDASTWALLPPQDKYHFRYLYQNFGFQPDELRATPINLDADARIQQRHEMERIIGKVTPTEMWRLEDAKQELLQRFWAERASDE